jgi:hypothetical protein
MSWLIAAAVLLIGFFTALHVANNGFQFSGGGDNGICLTNSF